MKFNDLSIKSKITYLYLPFVLIPIILFFILSTNLYEESITDRSLSSMEDNNILVADRVDDILTEAESSANYLTISINTLINNSEFQGQLKNDIKLYNLISNELTYATLIYEHIDSIAFYDIDQRLYYTTYQLSSSRSKIDEYQLYQELVSSNGRLIWFDLAKRVFLTQNKNAAVATLGKKIWNIDTGETIGYLFINVSEQTITDIFDDQISDYYIYNESLDMISSYRDEASLRIESKSLKTFLNNDDQSMLVDNLNNRVLVSKVNMDKVGWILMSQTDLKEITTDFNDLLLILSLMLGVIIILDIVVSRQFNRLITDPIIQLKGGVEEISRGNFDYQFKVKNNDEIGLFAESFNHMSTQIKGLLTQVELEEEQKRTFELALIQQQIKPHFLYNTLDIILKLSQMGQSRKAEKVTKRLADYYKNSLSSGSDYVTLENEIKITKDYLELQKIRYSDILDYKIDFSDHIKNREIPKLTLQPLVENAIYHGLKYKETPGEIVICDEMNDQGYYIIVKDNGNGMTKDQLKLIQDYLSKNEFEYNKKINDSFGMRNVNHRLKLFFGDDYNITMTSEVGVGTEIKIRLPKERIYD